MVDLLGKLNILKARGEAEAELAFLNREGYIDAVLTDDVDALVFGAKKVVRKYVFCVPSRRRL